MTQATVLRLAVIGAGFFAQFHYEAWTRLPGVTLVGLAERDAEKARKTAERFGIPEQFNDAEVMIERLQPDLLDIVTPPETHADLVALAARYGLPCICQKPLAPSLAEAEAIVADAGEAGIMLAVHENFRFMPWYREARRLLDAGVLGRPLNILFRLRPGDGQGPQAYLDRQPYFQTMPRFLVHETAIHFIDTFRFLLGEVEAVTARLRRLNPAIAGEDAGFVLFEFADGAAGLFDGNRLVDHQAENPRLTMGEMWLEGEAAVLRLDGDGRLWLRPRGEPEREYAYSWENRGYGGDCVYAYQAHVLGHLREGTALETAASDYLVNLRIEEAIYRSHQAGVRIDLANFGS